MAIYSGTWIDDEGVPFDHRGIGRGQNPQGNTAQVLRSGRTHPCYRSAFYAMISMCIGTWRTQMSHHEKALYNMFGCGRPQRRDGYIENPIIPFGGFATHHGGRFFHGFQYGGDCEGTGGIPPMEWKLVGAYTDTQAIEVLVTTDPDYEPAANDTLFIYQLDPTRQQSVDNVRFTRLSYVGYDYVPDHEYRIFGSAPFKIESPLHTYIFLRWFDSYTYTRWELLHCLNGVQAH